MSVLSGYSKYKRYILTSSGYKLCSHWTSSNTVHFDDGNTAQTKLGAISGITDSLTATSSNVALSAKAGKNLQDQVTELNTGITLVDGGTSDISTIKIHKSPNCIISQSGLKMYETVFSGYISLSSYIIAGEERYLGYVSNPYPSNPSAAPIVIPAMLMTVSMDVTQVAALYIKGNGGIYLSAPPSLKSTKLQTICIPICKQYCYYH